MKCYKTFIESAINVQFCFHLGWNGVPPYVTYFHLTIKTRKIKNDIMDLTFNESVPYSVERWVRALAANLYIMSSNITRALTRFTFLAIFKTFIWSNITKFAKLKILKPFNYFNYNVLVITSSMWIKVDIARCPITPYEACFMATFEVTWIEYVMLLDKIIPKMTTR